MQCPICKSNFKYNFLEDELKAFICDRCDVYFIQVYDYEQWVKRHEMIYANKHNTKKEKMKSENKCEVTVNESKSKKFR